MKDEDEMCWKYPDNLEIIVGSMNWRIDDNEWFKMEPSMQNSMKESHEIETDFK